MKTRKLATVVASVALAGGAMFGLSACGGSDAQPTWSSYAESVEKVNNSLPQGDSLDSDSTDQMRQYADGLRHMEDSPSKPLDTATDELADDLDAYASAVDSGDTDKQFSAQMDALEDLSTVANNLATAPQNVQDAWGYDGQTVEGF